jgi:type IV pilus assembly protein PilC
MAQAAAANVKTKPAAAAKPAVWRWSGKTKQGEVRSGEMEAHEQSAVEARLRQMGIEPSKVKK